MLSKARRQLTRGSSNLSEKPLELRRDWDVSITVYTSVAITNLFLNKLLFGLWLLTIIFGPRGDLEFIVCYLE